MKRNVKITIISKNKFINFKPLKSEAPPFFYNAYIIFSVNLFNKVSNKELYMMKKYFIFKLTMENNLL